MPSNVRSLSCVPDYEQALAHFENTKQPRRAEWYPTQRPLDKHPGGSRKHHYRLEKDGDAFNVILYSTVMARFEKPRGHERVVEYVGDGSMTSNQFMWKVLNLSKGTIATTLDGVRVVVPVMWGHRTRLTYVGDKLDTSRSSHPQLYTWVMSDEVKEKRKRMREVLVLSKHLAELRYPAFKANVAYQLNPYAYRNGPFVKVKGYLSNKPGDEMWFADYIDYAQAVYNAMYERNEEVSKDDPHPPLANFIRALENNVLKELGLAERRKRKALPMWMPVGKFPHAAFA